MASSIIFNKYSWKRDSKVKTLWVTFVVQSKQVGLELDMALLIFNNVEAQDEWINNKAH